MLAPSMFVRVLAFASASEASPAAVAPTTAPAPRPAPYAVHHRSSGPAPLVPSPGAPAPLLPSHTHAVEVPRAKAVLPVPRVPSGQSMSLGYGDTGFHPAGSPALSGPAVRTGAPASRSSAGSGAIGGGGGGASASAVVTIDSRDIDFSNKTVGFIDLDNMAGALDQVRSCVCAACVLCLSARKLRRQTADCLLVS